MVHSGYDKPDVYTQKAKKAGYAARSIYKLEEMDKKYKLLKNGQKVLDLGAFPGSWSQYALKKVGPKGIVVGIDIQNIEKSFAPNHIFLNKSILDADLDFSQYAPFHLVLSDMAPNTTGVKDVDQMGSIELSEMAVEMAKKYMKKDGIFICKIFQGEGFDEFYKILKSVFVKMKSFKPEATRSNSKEIYAIGWGLK